jgi:hypothetical protein
MSKSAFLRFAGIAAFLTAITTLAIHFIGFQVDNPEDRLLLASNPSYILHKWMIIVHCLLVILSMFGVATILKVRNAGLAALGALFFSVFGIAETSRMLGVLAYLNPLRITYLESGDEAIRQILQLQMDSFDLSANVLFLLFILSFALGNLFFGLGLMGTKGADFWMGMGFLLWAMLTFLALGNDFLGNEILERVVELNNKFYQPAMRGFIGWWLWTRSSRPILS